MKTFKVNVNKINNAKKQYDLAVGEIEAKLSEFIDFEFSVLYQPSDGLVILNLQSCENSPLEKCIEIIEKEGKLSYEDYRDIRI